MRKNIPFIIHLSSIILVLLFSCNLDEVVVTDSILTVSLNGTDIKDKITGDNRLTINLDKKDDDKENSIASNGYLELTCIHYNRDEKLQNADFTFESTTLPLVAKDGNTAYINLSTAKLSIGYHIIDIISKVNEKFNKKLTILVSSNATEINLSYSIISPISGLKYQKDDEPSALEGSAKGDNNVLFLATNTSYSLKVESKDTSNLGNLTFKTEGQDSSGIPLLRISGKENENKTLITSKEKTDEALVENYKSKGLTDGLPTLTVSLDGTELQINCFVILRQYSEISIDENDSDKNLIKYLSLTRDEGAKSYTVNIIGNVADGALEASLPSGTQSSLKDIPIPESDWFSSGIHYGKSNISGSDETYFDLYFDGEKREVKITPRKDTVYNNKNIDFYLHLRDSSSNYLGYWKILVGGIVERIEISVSELDGNPQKSGSIKATVYPQSADVQVLWYISDRQYSPNVESQSPQPSEEVSSRSLISMSPSLSTHTNTSTKTYTILMKNRISSSGIRQDEYYYSAAAIPLMKEGVSTLLYTLGSIAGKAYLTAVVIKTATNGEVVSDNDYTIYKSIPLTVSSNGEISVHSEIGVSRTRTSEGKTYTLDPYKDENGVNTLLPNRELGQSFPETVEDGKYGNATRSFYFAHNATGSINIDISGTDESVKITRSVEADKLFTISETNLSNGVTITLIPTWFSYYQDYLRNPSGKAKPPVNKREQNEAYGAFTDYIGTAYLYYQIGNTKGILRIVIYDANLYS